VADLNYENPLVAELVANAGDPPTLVLLEGYLGSSTRTGYIRIYASALMDGWLDIPHSRVKRVDQRKPQKGFRFETDLVWVEHNKLSGNGFDRVYPGGSLSGSADSDLTVSWKPQDNGDSGGGDPSGGATKVMAPPFG
jgi:hypothetical protein